MDKETIQKFQQKKHFYENVETLENHLDKFFKKDEMVVFHEMLSLDFHLDVFFITPKEDDYNLLLTSGMSILEMQVPESISNKEDYRFAELMLILPKEISFDKVIAADKNNGWIVDMLKETARFPHHYDTFLSEGHSLQATADLQPYSEFTKFAACVILPSVTFDADFTEIQSPNGLINIYSLFPLYKNELEYKLQNGYNKFLDLLINADAKEIFDNNRKNLLE
ncbi:hypothetical protein FACS189430_04140 [Bacteroidia bacterium]|nr:hypothetical protein FACS189430_04140 [Bacteroidia bacterium]